MAFSCVLSLKEECDGCGACEDTGHAGYRRLAAAFRWEDDDPFTIEYDDEE